MLYVDHILLVVTWRAADQVEETHHFATAEVHTPMVRRDESWSCLGLTADGIARGQRGSVPQHSSRTVGLKHQTSGHMYRSIVLLILVALDSNLCRESEELIWHESWRIV